MRKTLITALSGLLLAACSTAQEKNPVLSVEGGKLIGIKTQTEGVYAYRGIPYAAAPVGELRWKAPQPVKPWEGVKVADTFGNAAYQEKHMPGEFYAKEFFYDGDAPFSEDCLYLNVWTKAPGDTGKKLPVAMWIHGGAFMAGWGFENEMDGEAWAAEDVVLVTINYRLGIFGFFNHPELTAESGHNASGNYGLMDQIAALKWIKANIAQFGGDPDNVTIVGQSAGAASVKYLCTSPLTDGLFNKAVIQSGGGVGGPGDLMRGKLLADIESTSAKMLEDAGYASLADMRAASTEEIFNAYEKYKRETRIWNGPGTQPCIDNYVLVGNFNEAIEEGYLKDIPYLIGYTANDIGDLAGGIKDFCLIREASGKPAYAYKFARALPGDNSGAFHSSELWYTFHTLGRCWRPFIKADYDLSERMVKAWTGFVKDANPGWAPCTADHPQGMVFQVDETANADTSKVENI